MSSNSELFALLDNLVDGWCERRALPPLRILLDFTEVGASRGAKFAQDVFGADETASFQIAV